MKIIKKINTLKQREFGYRCMSLCTSLLISSSSTWLPQSTCLAPQRDTGPVLSGVVKLETKTKRKYEVLVSAVLTVATKLLAYILQWSRTFIHYLITALRYWQVAPTLHYVLARAGRYCPKIKSQFFLGLKFGIRFLFDSFCVNKQLKISQKLNLLLNAKKSACNCTREIFAEVI